MFGFGKKNRIHDVRLTEKEINQLEKNMSSRELKDFRKRQKKAEKNRFWDMMIMASILDEKDL